MSLFSKAPETFVKKKDYVFGAELGTGAFGAVSKAHWQAHDPPIDVAVKCIKKKLIEGHEDDIRNEIRALDGLSHPNIIVRVMTAPPFDVLSFESKKTWYLVYELASGGEVFERIYERGKFTEKDAVHTIQQLLSGVAYLHEHNVVHRDIKPENLIFRAHDSDDVVIADFGIAVKLQSDGEVIKSVAGSPGYAAPEVLNQLGHSKPVDVWSSGIVAFTLLSGYAPFRSTDRKELIDECTRARITFPDRYWKNVSQHAKDFVLALVKPDPATRPTAQQALKHPWLAEHEPDTSVDLSAGVRENWNAKRAWKKAFAAIALTQRLQRGSGASKDVVTAAAKADADDGSSSDSSFNTAPPHSPRDPASPSQAKHDSSRPPDMKKVAEDVANLKV